MICNSKPGCVTLKGIITSDLWSKCAMPLITIDIPTLNVDTDIHFNDYTVIEPWG